MSTGSPPPVSVLLAVHNGARWIADAVDSVIQQTHRHWELIIIDDGSTDSTPQLLAKYTDPRIRCIRQVNRGLAASLNRAIALSRGPYLARLDHDDFSFPHRFEKQAAFLDANPQCGVVGTWAQIWAENRATPRMHQPPPDNLALQFDLLLGNPIVHSSVMIRKTVFDRVGLYTTEKDRQPQDYELWSRVARSFELANLPEVLHVYREVSTSISRNQRPNHLERLVHLSAENLAWASRQSVPAAVHHDSAALAHGAIHLLSPSPCLSDMYDLLRDASQYLCARACQPLSALLPRVETRWIDIEYHHRLSRMPSFLRTCRRWIAPWYRKVAAFSNPSRTLS